MIRFIDLKDQICDGVNEFAFWDTTVDEFKGFSGHQTWDTIKEFEKDYEESGENELARYLSLIPKDWEVEGKKY